MGEFILEMSHITKTFPGVVADNDVTLKVRERSIHALIGENGAGKSTLMNILCGLEKPDEGEIVFEGNPVNIGSTYGAIALGIGMVHQHFMLVPGITVLENILLGPDIKTRMGLTDYKKGTADVTRIIEEYDFPVDLNKKAWELSVGEMQRVEILKALYRGAQLLVLDEPTAVLTPQETEKLFVMLQNLIRMGKTVLFISHKLKEVLAISSQVTVMREGRVTGEIATADANEQLLASMMVGRDVVMRVEKDEADPNGPVLEVKGLSAYNDRRILQVKDVSFTVHAGEILGIAGVDGNGQNELIEVLTGLRKRCAGTMALNGDDVSDDSCLARRSKGTAHIPADRMLFGIDKACTVHENLILNVHAQKPYASHMWMDNKRLRAFSSDLIERFDVAAASPDVAIRTLSGGNMQKVVVAREIAGDPHLLVAAQPTRGVDVGAIEFIHRELIRLRDEGKAVLLVSAELEEILSLSDRILVMYEGEMVAEFVNSGVDELEIGLYMTGAKRMEAMA